MTIFIIKSYFSLLLSIGMGALFLFILGFYFILRIFSSSATPASFVSNHNDFIAISGEADITSTQLDLARAYIETGRFESAKKVLKLVMKQGSGTEQQEAKRMLAQV